MSFQSPKIPLLRNSIDPISILILYCAIALPVLTSAQCISYDVESSGVFTGR